MIQNTVSEIIAKYQKAAPVKVVSVANELGLKVYHLDSMPDEISGMIRREDKFGGNSGYAIFVNGKHANVRRRFTIAHEIGHYVLHRDLIGDGIVEDALLRANGLTNAIERQANTFAADLLMPWSLIMEAGDKGIVMIDKLAKLFEVSKDAMSYRLLGVPYADSTITTQP
jgi:Zn-dependent peptidase ImmA (M78 family)